MRRRSWIALAGCAGLVLASACGSAEQSKAGTVYSVPRNLGSGPRTCPTRDTFRLAMSREPMITRDWLLTKPATLQRQLSQPRVFQHTGYFPTIYRIGYDEAANAYEISLVGMVMRQAS